MIAFTRHVYGGPEVLRIGYVEKPILGDKNVLIRIRANSANPADWYILKGKPFFSRFVYGLFRPKNIVPGSDFSGIVESVGKDVTHLKAGDRVFGSSLQGGAFAQYISIPADACALMPHHSEFAEMAAMPIAGVTALEALITYGNLQKGESVMINGATGGVGHLAVQIAKAYGANVTAVCASKNISFARELGADKVIAYDSEDVQMTNAYYDLVIDINGNLSYEDYQRLGKRAVSVGFTTMKQMLILILKKSFGKFPIQKFTVSLNSKNMDVLRVLIEQEKIKPYLQQTLSYEEIPSAIAQIKTRHTKGKIAMLWPNTSI